MHILASIFDPADNGFDITDAAALLGFLVLIVGTIVGLTRWLASLVRKIVREEISAYTRPIQPEANGGLSLPDVARMTYRNHQMLQLIAQRQGIDWQDE